MFVFATVLFVGFLVSIVILMAVARLFGARSATFGACVLTTAASFFVALLVTAVVPGSEKVAVVLSAVLSVFVYRKFLEMSLLGAILMSVSFLVISLALLPIMPSV